jgi:hypothetical protein
MNKAMKGATQQAMKVAMKLGKKIINSRQVCWSNNL